MGTGLRNCAFGSGAGTLPVAGSDNTLLGFSANTHNSSATNCIVIGSGALSQANNDLAIGNNTFRDNIVTAVADAPTTHRLRIRIGTSTYYIMMHT